MILLAPAVSVQNRRFGPQQVLFATGGNIPALWSCVQRNTRKPSFLHTQGPRRAPRHFWPGGCRSIVVSGIGSCLGSGRVGIIVLVGWWYFP